MPQVLLAPQALALIFEFLDRLSAARFSRTCRYAYEVFHQALLREPDEFAFYFSRYPTQTQDDAENKVTYPMIICGSASSARKISVWIELGKEMADCEGIVLLEQRCEKIVIKYQDQRGFNIVANKNSALHTVLEVLFDFFRLHLSTRNVSFYAVAASIVLPISKWMKKEGRNNSKFWFSNLPDACGLALDIAGDASERGKLIAESVAHARVHSLDVTPWTKFSVEDMNMISQSVTRFCAQTSECCIENERFVQWSPNQFIASLSVQYRFSDEAVLAWIVDTRRSPGHCLDVWVSLECHTQVCHALLTHPQFQNINKPYRPDFRMRFARGEINLSVINLKCRVLVNYH